LRRSLANSCLPTRAPYEQTGQLSRNSHDAVTEQRRARPYEDGERILDMHGRMSREWDNIVTPGVGVSRRKLSGNPARGL
jgi:hypothetical protein